ncbi:MAG: DNA/RNA non-specific endonuclease [Sulfurovum sp.]
MRKNQINLVIKLLDLVKKYPKILLPILGVLGVFYSFEAIVLRPNSSYMGVPKTTQIGLNTFNRTLRNSDFMVGYSDIRGNPLWVTYLLTKLPEGKKSYKRPATFFKDWRNITQLTTDDYTKSGYDRGHMAPNSAISKLYGKSSQIDTFFMTNITPQRPNLNRKIWRRLEAVEFKEFTKIFDKVWVITGPIFDDKTERLSSSDYIEIPDEFYKVYIGLKGKEEPKALAFIMPQTVRGDEPLTRFVTSIDEVEKKTNLDFFAGLDDNIENKIEKSTEIESWNLKAFSRSRSRS